MFKFFRKFSLENFKEALLEIFRRSPLSAIVSILIFVDLIVLVRFGSDLDQDLENILLKGFFTLLVSFFFSLALYLLAESKDYTNSKTMRLQGLTFVFALLFYYFFEENVFATFEEETVLYIVLTLLGVVSFLFISPFFKKFVLRIKSQDDFYFSTFELVLRIGMSAIVGIVTTLLGFAALASLFTLFEINFIDDDKWFGYWAIFSLSLFAPFFLMANLPKIKTEYTQEADQVRDNKFYSFLINYIALPAIVIYFVILYAYSIKVLLNFSDWPQGEISWMVIFFSVFGYLIYFATFIYKERFKAVDTFRKVLPIAVLLQTFMLFYAIGLRINQYDLTINRYLVVVFGLWLFGLSLYYIISKKKDLSLTFYSILLVVIFISIGPWSVYVVPEWRQYNTLERNLEEAGILENSDISPLDSYKSIDARLSGKIYSGIDYLCRFHGCKSLEPLFSEELEDIRAKHRQEWEENKEDELERAKNQDPQNEEYIKNIEEREYVKPGVWYIVQELTTTLKVEPWYGPDSGRSEEPQYWRYENIEGYNYNRSVEVSGFDHYAQLSSEATYLKELDMPGSGEAGGDQVYYSASLNLSSGILSINLDEEELESYEIEESVINSILEAEDSYIEPSRPEYGLKALLSDEDMTFDLVGEDYDVRLVLRSISLSNPNWQGDGDKTPDGPEPRTISRGNEFADGYVLIKEK